MIENKEFLAQEYQFFSKLRFFSVCDKIRNDLFAPIRIVPIFTLAASVIIGLAALYYIGAVPNELAARIGLSSSSLPNGNSPTNNTELDLLDRGEFTIEVGLNPSLEKTAESDAVQVFSVNSVVNPSDQSEYQSESNASIGAGQKSGSKKIEVYYQFSCPYCEEHLTESVLPLTQTDAIPESLQIKFLFLPDQGQDISLKSKVAACLPEQKIDLEVVQNLFLSSFTNEDQAIAVFLADASPELKQSFKRCVSGEQSLTKLEQNLQTARRHNIRTLPAILFDGQLFLGIIPVENLLRAIRKSL